MLIDAHLHIGLHGISSSNLIDYLDRNQIDCCWLLTWEEKYPSHPGYRPMTVAEVFETFQKYPSRVIPMYAPDPAGDSWESTMAFWHRLGIKGIGELKVTSSWYSTKVTTLLDVASKLRLPIVFHMEEERSIYWPVTNSAVDKTACKLLNRLKVSCLGRESLEYITKNSPLARSILDSRYHFIPSYLPEFSGLEGRLEAYPEVTFIGHGPLFWKGISADMGLDMFPKGPVEKGGIVSKLLRQYPNLYADISGMSGYNALYRDAKFSQHFLGEFSSRILFGTDNASLGLKYLLSTLRLSSTEIKRICGENALRIMEAAGI